MRQLRLQTKLKWWQWKGTPKIILNKFPDRRGKWKRAITKCCLTVCRSIENGHGVWAGASIARVWWYFLQHISDIWWCSCCWCIRRRIRMILRSARAAHGRRTSSSIAWSMSGAFGGLDSVLEHFRLCKRGIVYVVAAGAWAIVWA